MRGGKYSEEEYISWVIGGTLDAGVYPIEFATGILGENPIDVKGFASLCETGVDDFAVMNMKFKSGALANLSCGLSAATIRDARIYGTNGYIVVYDFLATKKCELFDQNKAIVECFEDNFEDGFIYQIEHFADLYRNNKIESDLIPHQDTIACAGVFDELMKQWKM